MPLSLASKSLDEIWRRRNAELPIKFDLRPASSIEADPETTGASSVRDHILVVEDKVQNDQLLTIEGKMHSNPNETNVYFGWFIKEGKVQFWSAFGHESPHKIYGKTRWVV